ncbi:TetR/AcrR family transcriptional regulator [Chryseobacterium sp. A301]
MDKKKTQILKTSIKLFRQKGYKETTLRDIAKKMGVTAPALYNFICKKDEILVWLCDELALHFNTIPLELQEFDGTDLEKFNFFLKRHLETVYNHYELYETALRYWEIADTEANQKFSHYIQFYLGTFESLANQIIPKANRDQFFNPNLFSLIVMQISNQLPKWLDSSYKPFDFHLIAGQLSTRLLNGYSH